jgi:hypothetical protein
MNTHSPLALGFIEGIKFDRVGKVTMPILENPKLEVIRQHAATYHIGQRTAYRWIEDGVNLSDPLEVALHVASLKHPAPAAVAAVRKILSAELESLT